MEGRVATPWLDRGYVIGFAAVTALQIAGVVLEIIARAPFPLANVVMVAFLVACMVRIHGSPGTMAFLALIVAIPFASEFSGVLAGVPYGAYRYVDAPPPFVFGLVPLFILIAWVGIGYMAIATTTIALGRSRWWLAPLDGLLATAWDAVVDPLAVHARYWVWDSSQGFYGVPLSNFLGWFLVVTLFSLAVRWVWARDTRAPGRTSRLMLALIPPTFLVSTVAFALIAVLNGFYLAAILGIGIVLSAVAVAAYRLRGMPRAFAGPSPWARPARAAVPRDEDAGRV